MKWGSAALLRPSGSTLTPASSFLAQLEGLTQEMGAILSSLSPSLLLSIVLVDALVTAWPFSVQPGSFS